MAPSFMIVALAATVAAAEPVGTTQEVSEAAPHTWVNLRVGASSGNRNRRPELCGEISPLSRFSVEACGTGSGFLHHDPQPELAHFRARLQLLAKPLSAGWLMLHLNAGFAELQVGEDDPGFHFTRVSPSRTEVSGPEIGAGLRGVLPLGRGFELIGDLAVGVAWFAHSRELVVPMGQVMPSIGATVGVGF